MSRSPQPKLETRVAAAAETALDRDKQVTLVGLLDHLGWLPDSVLGRWRQGRVGNLEDVLPVSAARLGDALGYLRSWAERRGLRPTEIDYVAASRDRKPLRFTANGPADVERACRTHWVSPELSDGQRERLTQRHSKPPDLVVVQPVKEWACADCGGTGDFLIMDDAGPLCLTCADMDHLLFLPAGDAALTRRAKQASRLSAVVVRWSRTRGRYERQGVLVEEPALEQAEEQCLADEQVRMRRRERDRERRAEEDERFGARLADQIRRLLPGCPSERAAGIARHTSLRGSGRVGRSAAARALDEDAITLAVVASVRHEDTSYDSLLMSGVPRDIARDQVRPVIDRVLAAWASPSPPGVHGSQLPAGTKRR